MSAAAVINHFPKAWDAPTPFDDSSIYLTNGPIPPTKDFTYAPKNNTQRRYWNKGGNDGGNTVLPIHIIVPFLLNPHELGDPDHTSISVGKVATLFVLLRALWARSGSSGQVASSCQGDIAQAHPADNIRSKLLSPW